MKIYSKRKIYKFLKFVNALAIACIPLSFFYGAFSIFYAIRYSPLIGIVNLILAIIWGIISNFIFINYMTHIEMTVEDMEEKSDNFTYRLNLKELEIILDRGHWKEWPEEGIFLGSLFRAEDINDKVHADIVRYYNKLYFLTPMACLYVNILRKELIKKSYED